MYAPNEGVSARTGRHVLVVGWTGVMERYGGRGQRGLTECGGGLYENGEKDEALPTDILRELVVVEDDIK